jgi:ribose transport system permease protein
MHRSFTERQLAAYWPVLVFVALLSLNVALKGRYTLYDIRSLCANALPLALISMGQYFVVTTNRIDLSLGPIASFAGAVVALLSSQNVIFGFATPILIGALAGLLNGLLVARFRFPSIIVTLATMSVWQGVALIVLPNPGGSVPPQVQNAMTRGLAFPPVPLLLLILLVIVGGWIMRTRFGLHLQAVGGDEGAAAMSGVATERVVTGAFVLGGIMAALGGSYLAVATASGSPTIGDGYILSSIATVVVGGVALTGGRGRPSGAVIGALTLTVIGSLLYFAGVSSFYQAAITGIILLAVASGNSAFNPIQRRIAVTSVAPQKTAQGHGA